MNSEVKGSTIILEDTAANASEFLHEVVNEYAALNDKNIIINLSNQADLAIETLLPYLEISNKHRASKKSFVLVVVGFDYDDEENPDELVIVPTLQEAFDIIEMEEIERDLGF